MDRPLTTWYCDVCGNKIENIKEGNVIWKNNKESKQHSFKIIHRTNCSLNTNITSAALENFIGENGLTYLLSKLSKGPIITHSRKSSHCHIIDFDEFIDFIRRVQIPYYEQARLYFSESNTLKNYSNANRYFPYLPEQLKMIILKHEKK